jgi:hypothetical protein
VAPRQRCLSTTASWLDFGMFKLIVAGMRKAATQFLDSTGKLDAP